MANIVQKNFSSGEVSEDIEVRSDFVSNQTGLRKCRNAYIRRQGGLSRRPGSRFSVEVAKNSENKERLLPFQFAVGDSFIIEMGPGYFRFHRNGAVITSVAHNINSASGDVIQFPGAHSYSLGDEVYINASFQFGRSLANEKLIVIGVPNPNEIQVADMFLDTVDFSPYGLVLPGGTISDPYEIGNPFAEDELFDVRFSQTGDVLTLVHFNHGVYDLRRITNTSWDFTKNYLQGNYFTPTNITIAKDPSNTGTYSYEYLISTVDQNGLESFPAYNYISLVKKLDGTDITTNHSVTVDFNGVIRFVRVYRREVPYGLPPLYVYRNYAGFELIDIIETPAPMSVTFTMDGNLLGDPSQKPLNPTIIYGQVIGKNYDGTNGNTFDLTNLHPTAVSTSKERRYYGGQNAYPGVAYGSKAGYYNDFKAREPGTIVASDPVKLNTPSENVGKILHLLDFKRLFMFTDSAEIIVKGSGEDGVVSAVDLPNPEKVSENGISNVRPLIVDKSVLYVQARGSIIRDMMAEVTLDSYPGDEISLFSSHLIDNYEIIDWAFLKTPHPIVWIVRNDGVLLSITYNANQQIKGFARHDLFGGEVESVASVAEAQNDVLYLIVKRTINGQTKRYIESFVTKEPELLVNKTYMDSNLSYDGRNFDQDHTMRLGTDTDWNYGTPLRLQSFSDYFNADYHIGKYIFLYVGNEVLKLKITAIVDGFEATVEANKNVPEEFQLQAMTTWALAVQRVSGLTHLEDEAVCVLADGNVVSSPLNSEVATIVVTSGEVVIGDAAAVIHVGLPYITDVETLDFDTAERLNSMADKNLLTNRFNARVLKTSSFFAGSKEPEGDDYLEGLNEVKVREYEDYDDANELKTGLAEVAIEASYRAGGRVFARQVDPLPMNILSLLPDVQTN